MDGEKDSTRAAPLPPDFDPDGAAEHDGLYGLPTRPEDAALVLLPVPWEVTVSYRGGTARAPDAILAASRQVELFDRETGHPYRHGIAMAEVDPRLPSLQRDAVAAAAAGLKAEVDRLAGELQQVVQEATARWYSEGKTVGIIGGEHGVSLGALQAAAAQHGEFGLLQIDAHADLRMGYEGYHFSHASFAANVLEMVPAVATIVQVGIRDYSFQEYQAIDGNNRVTTFFEADFGGGLSADLRAEIVAGLPRKVWISLDIDGLDPSLCPHTGTPVPGGLTWREATALLADLGRSGREIIGFDLCEVVPAADSTPGDGLDENVAARILYKLCGWTLWGR